MLFYKGFEAQTFTVLWIQHNNLILKEEELNILQKNRTLWSLYSALGVTGLPMMLINNFTMLKKKINVKKIFVYILNVLYLW